MKRILLLSLSFIIFLSCRSGNYQRELSPQSTGVDFSKGRWLLGNIDADSDIKDKLTKLIIKDFSKHLQGRLTNALDDKSLLIARQVPVNPTTALIKDLKKGTNYDYFINVKCSSGERSDLHAIKGEFVDRFTVDKYYYSNKLTTAVVQLEIYDLNLGQVVYSQKVRGSSGRRTTLIKVDENFFIGCYKEIMKHLNKKSL